MNKEGKIMQTKNSKFMLSKSGDYASKENQMNNSN
jgi:hypothetical protein